MSQRTLIASVFGSFVFLVAPLAGTAAAQEQPRLVAEAQAGWIGFADDGIVSEGMVGGAARWYTSPRISIGPEVVYINGSNHSHLIVTGNVTCDLLPIDRRSRRMTPFLVAGGGLFQTRETFFNGDFTSTEAAFTAGGGVTALVGDRVSIGLDMRVGWELHLRVTGFVGLSLGRYVTSRVQGSADARDFRRQIYSHSRNPGSSSHFEATCISVLQVQDMLSSIISAFLLWVVVLAILLWRTGTSKGRRHVSRISVQDS